MATFFLILIFCCITAFITFTVTRSLYINRFKAWYQEEVVKEEKLEKDSKERGGKMYRRLAAKHELIYQIDHTIIPDYVSKAFGFSESALTKGSIRDLYETARWLGYDLTLAKRPLPPPPQFKHRPTPKELKEELAECWDADARVSGIETGEA